MVNIAVVFGGYSSEYEVSVKSGKFIYENLKDNSDWNVFEICISNDKNFVRYNEKVYDLDYENFSFNANGRLLKPDAVFNIVHGDPGENGNLAEILERNKINGNGKGNNSNGNSKNSNGNSKGNNGNSSNNTVYNLKKYLEDYDNIHKIIDKNDKIIWKKKKEDIPEFKENKDIIQSIEKDYLEKLEYINKNFEKFLTSKHKCLNFDFLISNFSLDANRGINLGANNGIICRNKIVFLMKNTLNKHIRSRYLYVKKFSFIRPSFVFTIITKLNSSTSNVFSRS